MTARSFPSLRSTAEAAGSAVVLLFALAFAGCSSGRETSAALGDQSDPNRIVIDGSSTVFPLSEVVAERFHELSRVPVTVDGGGTRVGFRRLCAGEISIAGASRPITQDEMTACQSAHVEVVEMPVAYDGIVVAVHQSNYWTSALTLAELRQLFGTEAPVHRWREVRSDWPDREVHVYGPGNESGTFDYFTEVVLGTPGQMRTDYGASEDDDYIVRRIVRDRDAIGYFGYAYFVMNRATLRAVSVDDGNALNGPGAVAPTPETIADGTYQPLSRPLFIYVNRAHLEREPVQRLAELYVSESRTLVPQAGMVLLRPRGYEMSLARLRERTTGSVFLGAALREGLTVEQALEAQ